MEPFPLSDLDQERIVIQLGRYYTRCGYSGEAVPRAIVKNPYELIQLTHHSTYEQYYEILQNFLRFIYLHKVQAKPKDSATVLVQNFMGPRQMHQAAISVIFNDLRVPLIFLVLDNTLPIYTTGGYTGLVVDVGYSDTRFFPVFQGIPIISAYKSLGCGAQELMQVTKDKLERRNYVQLTENAVEDILVRSLRFSFGRLIQEIQQIQTKTFQIQPVQTSSKLIMTVKDRFLPDSVFFGNLENDESNLASRILDSLAKCPIDTRKVLANHIIAAGGPTMLPGFQQRLQEELEKLIETEDYTHLKGIKGSLRVVPSLFPRNIINWIGASIFGSLAHLQSHSLSKDEFDEQGVPDRFGKIYLFGEPEEEQGMNRDQMDNRFRYSIAQLRFIINTGVDFDMIEGLLRAF